MRFVLVHGGGHGAWCWDLLVPELRKLGHEPVTMDLPGHGARRNELSTWAGYRDAVVEVLQPGDVLVGHSVGCGAATRAADVFTDLRHIVYLAGGLPVEGRSPISQINNSTWDFGDGKHQYDIDAAGVAKRPDDDEYQHFTSLERTTELFFHDCSPEVAAWAFEQLTPQRRTLNHESVSVPRFWEADLPRSLIQCTEDRIILPEWYAKWARRMGVKPLTIATSHSPFLSRPTELAHLLVQAVDTKPIGPMDPYGDGIDPSSTGS